MLWSVRVKLSSFIEESFFGVARPRRLSCRDSLAERPHLTSLHPPQLIYIPQASYSFPTTCFPTLNVINYLIAVPLVLAILNVNLGASFEDAMCQSS